MSKVAKTLERVLRGTADANISFEDLRRLLYSLGFSERIKGDHYIFTREGVEEIINIQPKGKDAKPYQVKQIRGLITRNGLAGADDTEESTE